MFAQLIRNNRTIFQHVLSNLTRFYVAINSSSSSSFISLAFMMPFMPYSVQTRFNFYTHDPVYGQWCQRVHKSVSQ